MSYSQNTKMRKIIGIDPGSKLTGWGVISSDGDSFEYINSGVIEATHTLPDRLMYIHSQLGSIMQEFRPEVAVIEDTFAHKFFKASLVLAQAQAICILACKQNHVDIQMIQSKSAKKILTGNGNAEKHFVHQQLRLLIPDAEFETNDASDALSLSLAHALMMRIVYS